MYESRRHPPLHSRAFARRLLGHLLVIVVLTVVSLAAGMAGYMYYEHLRLVDAFVNAAMLLGGMGPVNPLATDAGKLFAGLYALYAGLFFLISAGLVFAPLLHRVLHRLHWDEDKRS
jgi:glucose-6-phosphate-specific signal transduction histidine kinase